ncbi:copper chaperone PCu(A)C [Sphingomonas sp. IC-56]|uniref:copper chaperone PCu(A)C n=1 Tax=Sphingomonas sp. IC-56 TaxID=2898529 RepID=UPI001E3DBB64|nr:copper chaperone PCu(A)C [Sphingomonas sp. IC-56]MCD2324744.1 copper chaperone PCu(A)C [Sphingomonas sp. IC-56]
MRGILGIVAGALLLSACHQQPAEPAVEKAWARLPAVSGRPGAAYFTLKGGSQADKLVGIASPAATRAELHETMQHGGMSMMQPLREVALDAGKTVNFAPGGRHVMLFGLSPSLKPGAQIPLVLSLASGKKLEAQAQLVGAGDPQP